MIKQLAILATMMTTVTLLAQPAAGCLQSYVEMQNAKESTGVDEKSGGTVALKTRFMDTTGNWSSLKEFFFEDRPVFLAMNYADCPQLCQNQLKILAEKFSEAEMVPGKDFEFISISLDPREADIRTREVKQNFSRLLTGDASSEGIHFLVGKKADIDSVANSIGFKYVYVPSAGHYSHAPLCVALTAEGKISRYIHGLAIEASQLSESMKIAQTGEVAEESVSMFAYACLLFGVNPGQYTKNLLGLMKIAGVATVIIIGACVIPFWFRAPPAAKSKTEEIAAMDANHATVSFKEKNSNE